MDALAHPRKKNGGGGRRGATAGEPDLVTSLWGMDSGCGKREAHINWSMVTYQGSTCLEIP